MSRYLALWLPEFPLQAIVFAGAAPASSTPWAVLSAGPGACILAANTEARRQGVGAGQGEAEARVHCPGLLSLSPSPEAELHIRAWLETQWDEVTPRVQTLSSSLWLGDLFGLERLRGPILEQARRLRERLRQHQLDGRIGLARSSSAAVLAALAAGERAPAVWLLDAGCEARELARLPLAHLQQFPFAAIPPALRENGKRAKMKTGKNEALDWPGALDLLDRWGLKTLGDLARLPANGLSERLGRCGTLLQALARGEECGLLEPAEPHRRRLHLSLEWDPPEQDRERLLAALRSRLHPATETLERWDRVVERIVLTLCLTAPEGLAEAITGTKSGLVQTSASLAVLQPGDWRTTRRLLTPARDLRGLLQHIEAAMATRPPLPVALLTAAFDLTTPRRIQPRLFGEAGIDREKLERVMDRLKEILHDPAGRSFGRPQLLDSHHPEAFLLRPFTADDTRPAAAAAGNEAETDPPRLALVVFRFRPPHPVQLRLPRQLAAPSPAAPGPPLRSGLAPRSSGPATLLGAECRLPGVAATLRVIRCAGPWRSSGDWWTPHPWSRDEWDVELSNRGLYVLVHHRRIGAWFLEGAY